MKFRYRKYPEKATYINFQQKNTENNGFLKWRGKSSDLDDDDDDSKGKKLIIFVLTVSQNVQLI